MVLLSTRVDFMKKCGVFILSTAQKRLCLYQNFFTTVCPDGGDHVAELRGANGNKNLDCSHPSIRPLRVLHRGERRLALKLYFSKKMSLTNIFFLLLTTAPLSAFNLFGPSTPPTPQEKIAQLQEQQVDKPNDPVINYNLGVAYYKAGRADDALTSFQRSLEHTTNDKNLIKQNHYNLGNLRYKQALGLLPKNWETEKNLDPSLLQNVIKEVKTAITNYTEAFNLDSKNKKIENNLKHAKMTLDKLEKKLQDMQQKQKNQKQDQKQQEKDKQQSQDQQKDSSGKEQVKEDKKESDHNQDQSGRKQSTDDASKKDTQGKDDKLGDKKDEKKEQSDANHTQSPDKQEQQQPSDSQTTQGQQEKQQTGEQAGSQQEDMESRRMRAILENLQADESETQKKILMRQAGQQKQQPQSGQKPW
jgi:Ca-activated chloride channel homolog